MAAAKIETMAAWLIAALNLAGGGIVARLVVDYSHLLPNSHIGFLIYHSGPTIVLLWACAGATIAVRPMLKLSILLIALCGSIIAGIALGAP